MKKTGCFASSLEPTDYGWPLPHPISFVSVLYHEWKESQGKI